MLANAHYAENNYLAASKHFYAATRIRPTQPDAYYYLGHSLLSLESYKLAFLSFNQVLKLDPNNEIASREINNLMTQYGVRIRANDESNPLSGQILDK